MSDGSCYDPNGKMIAMETLTSIAPQGEILPAFDDETAELTPAPRVFLTQHMLLRALQRKAKSMGQITLRYNCGVISLSQHERKVIAQTTFGKIVADYCVGCDGPSGPTQKYVTGGKKSGPGLLTKSMTIAFQVRASIASLLIVDGSRWRGRSRLTPVHDIHKQ
jgi:2-polyprenyl-6-methoxyphenol hydroxylase-like FAD-dependent oxidoreductase